MIHAARRRQSTIVSKSICKDGGRTSYRGLVKVEEGAHGVRSHVRCDALILDEDSRSDTYPYMEINEQDARIGHEATVSKVGEEQLFYLMSRGLSEQQAMGMIVNGFIEPSPARCRWSTPSSGAGSSSCRWRDRSADRPHRLPGTPAAPGACR
jgi:ABC-type transport system involved in Fe-S cluster assembly, permease component